MWDTNPSFHAKVWWEKCGRVCLGWNLHFLHPLIGLPCLGDLLEYPMTSDSGSPHEKSIVYGRICYSICCPHMLLRHGNNDLRTNLRTEKCHQVPSSAVPAIAVFWSHSAFPEWNSTLSLLSKTCRGSFIFCT